LRRAIRSGIPAVPSTRDPNHLEAEGGITAGVAAPAGRDAHSKRKSNAGPSISPNTHNNALDFESGRIAAEGRSRSATRWWIAVLVGCMVATPFAWLLSYAAALPFYLGLFFFALFGLLIGASMVRVAAAGRPYSRAHVFAGTTVVVLFGWGLSIVNEAHDVPHDLAAQAADRTRDIGTMTRTEFQTKVADGIRKWMRESYPPGGTIGYVRWVLTSGKIEKNSIPELSRSLRRSQSGWVWAIGVVLSIGLFAFGIGSQTFPLRSGPPARK
jgi:hypothetical protein